jgi:hypothetical protein
MRQTGRTQQELHAHPKRQVCVGPTGSVLNELHALTSFKHLAFSLQKGRDDLLETVS